MVGGGSPRWCGGSARGRLGFGEGQRELEVGSSCLRGEEAGGYLEKGEGRTHGLLSGQKRRVRGTVHSVCQTSKEDKRAWGLPSALTFSSTSAPLWLCPLRQVSSLSELLLIYIVRAMMSALSNSVTAFNKYLPRGILVALNGGVCCRLNSCQNQNHTQPAFQEGYLDNPIKPLYSPPFISKLLPCPM